jgi:hypothetical protein
MDHVLGLVGKDFVLIAADMKVAHSVLTMKSDQDKCVPYVNPSSYEMQRMDFVIFCHTS